MSRSPRAAVWVLEHLVPGGSDPGLTGDLLEELAEGRSTRWLWAQVGLAVLAGYGRMLRRQWPALLFALSGACRRRALELIQRQNEAFEARLVADELAVVDGVRSGIFAGSGAGVSVDRPVDLRRAVFDGDVAL